MKKGAENTSKGLYLGIDFGTSGARYALIDDQGNLCSERKRAYPEVILCVSKILQTCNFRNKLYSPQTAYIFLKYLYCFSVALYSK
jgi:predicted NBD/HSP70 family sugar kinase